MEHEKILKEQDAAQFLGLKPRSLQAWRQRKCGPPFIRISARCVRYRMVDIEKWLDQINDNRTKGEEK